MQLTSRMLRNRFQLILTLVFVFSVAFATGNAGDERPGCSDAEPCVPPDEEQPTDGAELLSSLSLSETEDYEDYDDYIHVDYEDYESPPGT